jgi:pantothenate synthetase
MEKDLFEQIVMSVCNSEEITKQVMDIVYVKPSRFNKCEEGHTYSKNFTHCPHCYPYVTEDMFFKCNNRHFYNKELDSCPYCEPSVVVSTTQSNKKQELIDSLDYLKKKEHKTEKDKESISIIQAILNGMK